MNSLEETLAFAVDAARQAGDRTLSRFRSGTSVERKADGTPVTPADREAEEFLRDRIRRRFPDHRILGEEGGEEGPVGSPRRWILDPIDGTQSFIRGVPLYAVLVGLEVDGRFELGVARFPALDETFAAARGKGCERNGEAVHVSEVADPSRGTISMTSPALVSGREDRRPWAEVAGRFGLVRGFSDAYGHCLVAAGRIEAMIDPPYALWDLAALVPIVEEAGGRFTTVSGAPVGPGAYVVSSNGRVHDEIVERLSAAATPPAPA